MRDPSIYIKFSTLLEILRENLPPHISIPPEKEMELLLRLSRNTIKRSSVKLPAAYKNKVEKIASIEEDFAELITVQLENMRILKGHREIPKITKGSTEYSAILSLAAKIIDFAEAFDLSPDLAVTKYLKEAFKLLGQKPFLLSKLIYFNSKICSQEASASIVASDKNKGTSSEMSTIYFKLLRKKTKLNIAPVASDLIHFVNSAATTKRLKADPSEYIIAQFEGLEWTGNFPEPAQLYGEAAEKRYWQFMYKLHKDKPKVDSDYWALIKRLGNED